MISHIKGQIVRFKKDASKIVIDVNGVGYEVLLPTFVMQALSADGKEEGDYLELETYYHVSDRQPRPVLVGFKREFEKTFFEKLLEVEDIGPSRAAAALIFSVSTLANAIETNDKELLKRMPGVGDRTAQKIIATLQGKMTEWALLQDEGFATIPQVKMDIKEDAIDVLVNLGYKKGEASARVDQASQQLSEIRNAEDLIREVFKAQRSHGIQ